MNKDHNADSIVSRVSKGPLVRPIPDDLPFFSKDEEATIKKMLNRLAKKNNGTRRGIFQSEVDVLKTVIGTLCSHRYSHYFDDVEATEPWWVDGYSRPDQEGVDA